MFAGIDLNANGQGRVGKGMVHVEQLMGFVGWGMFGVVGPSVIAFDVEWGGLGQSICQS